MPAQCWWAAEKKRNRHLRPPRHQHGHSLWLDEAGEIEEITVLPIGVLHIAVADAHRRSRQDGDGIEQAFRGGVGLGLSIARRLTELMGGTIEVAESDLGGARFSVSLEAGAKADSA